MLGQTSADEGSTAAPLTGGMIEALRDSPTKITNRFALGLHRAEDIAHALFEIQVGTMNAAV